MGGFVYSQVLLRHLAGRCARFRHMENWLYIKTLKHYRHIVSAWAEKESTKGPENAGIVLDG
jgi:hypothetical protein